MLALIRLKRERYGRLFRYLMKKSVSFSKVLPQNAFLESNFPAFEVTLRISKYIWFLFSGSLVI